MTHIFSFCNHINVVFILIIRYDVSNVLHIERKGV